MGHFEVDCGVGGVGGDGGIGGIGGDGDTCMGEILSYYTTHHYIHYNVYYSSNDKIEVRGVSRLHTTIHLLITLTRKDSSNWKTIHTHCYHSHHTSPDCISAHTIQQTLYFMLLSRLLIEIPICVHTCNIDIHSCLQSNHLHDLSNSYIS